MRSMLLDELRKQYVVTARSKGLNERRLIFKYPVRIALNPVVSTLGLRLATIISGAPIVAVVLSLPTTGPLLLRSLLSQDMYLAGSFFLLLSAFTVVGTFVSDVVLAAMDPRIRMV
jgi:peptide/nickel transport system permease protein